MGRNGSQASERMDREVDDCSGQMGYGTVAVGLSGKNHLPWGVQRLRS